MITKLPDRMPLEPLKAYDALVMYLSMQPSNRSLVGLSKMSGISISSINRYAARWFWNRRLTEHQRQDAISLYEDRKQKHLLDIEEYKVKNRLSAERLFISSTRLLEKIQTKIESITMDELDCMSPLQLAMANKMIALSLDIALSKMAQFIAINELQEALSIRTADPYSRNYIDESDD